MINVIVTNSQCIYATLMEQFFINGIICLFYFIFRSYFLSDFSKLEMISFQLIIFKHTPFHSINNKNLADLICSLSTRK